MESAGPGAGEGGGPGSRQHVRRPPCGLDGAPAPPGGRSPSRGRTASWGGSGALRAQPRMAAGIRPQLCPGAHTRVPMCTCAHMCVCVRASGFSTPRGCFTGHQRHASLCPLCPRAHVFSTFGDKLLQRDRRQAAVSWPAESLRSMSTQQVPTGRSRGGCGSEGARDLS